MAPKSQKLTARTLYKRARQPYSRSAKIGGVLFFIAWVTAIVVKASCETEEDWYWPLAVVFPYIYLIIRLGKGGKCDCASCDE